jgi:hypothetical protein
MNTYCKLLFEYDFMKEVMRMAWHFRKSIKLGPIRINASKSGIGYSIGNKIARHTKTSTGQTYNTFKIPGTGISYTTKKKKK